MLCGVLVCGVVVSQLYVGVCCVRALQHNGVHNTLQKFNKEDVTFVGTFAIFLSANISC